MLYTPVRDDTRTNNVKRQIYILWNDYARELVEQIAADLRRHGYPVSYDEGTNISTVCRYALAQFAAYLGENSPSDSTWKRYAEIYRDVRAGSGKEPYHGKELQTRIGDEEDALIEGIIQRVEHSGVAVPNIRRGDIPNKKLAVLLALVFTAERIK